MFTRILLVLGLAFGLTAIALYARIAWGKGKEVVTEPTDMPAKQSVLDFTVKDIDGHDLKLSTYRGRVVLIVNVASKCGFTPQYAGLEKLYTQYSDQGLTVVGFPANNFGSQEPGTDDQIKKFCTSKYSVTFPMMSKISVKGDDKAPVYKYLTEEATNGKFAGDIEWNFNKFLVDRNGNIIARFPSGTKPDDPKLIGALTKALAAKAAP